MDNQNASTIAPTKTDYRLGLDIGIASVGWAVLGDHRIIDLGVRAFDKAETAKEGESLNLQRRSARLLRRRLARRAWRLTQLARLLKRHGLVANAKQFQQLPSLAHSTWQLRKEGLDRLLTPDEWARVIYHLCKHRGFHWVSRAEEQKADADPKGEGGRVKKGLAATQALMKEKNYRTAAEMVLAEFPQAQRNKQGDYSKALSRVLLAQEMALLFQCQRQHGNPHAHLELETAIRGTDDRRGGVFWQQKPALAGKDLLKMLGHCTFEPTEYRAPKASFTAEHHVWLTRLNNLRVIVAGVSRPLTEAERQAVIHLPYQSGEKFTYKHLKKALVKGGWLQDNFRFGGLAYPSEAQREAGKAKDPEDQPLVKLLAWHELKQTLKHAQLEAEWNLISTAALDGNPDMLDSIGWVLSVYKDDAEVECELQKLGLPGGSALIHALLGIRFDKFHALSLKALRRIVPLMHTGMRYDQAVASIAEYGHHSQRFVVGAGQHTYLPSFYEPERKYAHKSDRVGSMVFRDGLDLPRNPVVLRALNQARKVVNAIIREYGPPTAVHIEMARDLSRPKDERDKVKALQEEYRDRNEQAREQFATTFGHRPKAAELEKWLLYREQQGKCAYSLEALDLARVIDDPTYAQVDHALPYSRSYDDSKNNKVLVLTRENQNKGNRTPHEYLGGTDNSERWLRFVAWVESNKAYRQAKRSRLLRKNFGQDEASEFRERNLNDTRYICKFFKNYVEQHLQLASESTHQRCVVVNGQLTAFLRARWGLLKIRAESDRHHALDAAVVAACSHSMVKALADHHKQKELAYLREGMPDPETGEIINPDAHSRLALRFPEPWPHFRHELQQRLHTDDAATLREEMARLGTYTADELNALHPLFVSRAPQRRGLGEVHEGTIRSVKYAADKKSVVQLPLAKLSLSSLGKMVGYDDPRNQELVEGLRRRLIEHHDDGKKAFAAPFFKPSRPGVSAPVVRGIKIKSTQNDGLLVRNGVADLGPMTHVDVLQSKTGYTLMPAYVASTKKRLNASTPPHGSTFIFSLQKNDYLRISYGNTTHEGYFVMYENDGRLTLRAHDQPKPDKIYFRRSVASATNITKFNVDVLGRIYPATPEPRRGLA